MISKYGNQTYEQLDRLPNLKTRSFAFLSSTEINKEMLYNFYLYPVFSLARQHTSFLSRRFFNELLHRLHFLKVMGVVLSVGMRGKKIMIN